MLNLRRLPAAAAASVLAVGLPAAAAAAPGGFARVSVSGAGAQADGRTDEVALAGTGRLVAFTAEAANLVPGDTNGHQDAFVRDRRTGTTRRVSVSGTGGQADGASRNVALSRDGRYVAFTSEATNLVPGDTNGVADVFLHDRRTGATARVSVSGAGAQGDGASAVATGRVSADGRYVAFSSAAGNLVSGDTNGAEDVFVRDRWTGTTRRLSVSGSGGQGAGASSGAAISDDGRYVAFVSEAPDLVLGDTNGAADAFLRDRRTGTTRRLSVSAAGAQADDRTAEVVLSATGRYVGLRSRATNLAPGGDTNGMDDVFLRDRRTAAVVRVSVSGAGQQADHESYGLAVGASGRYVAFTSLAGNLVPGDAVDHPELFLRDVWAGTTRRLTDLGGGTSADGYSYGPSVSADSRHVAVVSVAANLVAGDTNGVEDGFVLRRP
ncbi:hypothetical protein GCM10010124_35440 [Pilimelia terevasa]|uniref:Uncharacterized protein n=1 Tax=Pilimelia terevasa TaxID=53372 RepID=A0A8J3BRD7_9ACTN|nr:PD40 domain-containing protein [Pilimelia terevasa]GGK39704.1 hypothetical protein GCM10010124_35440 [Pilimelia terevasa]